MPLRCALLLLLLALPAAAQDDGKDAPVVPSDLLLREEQPWSRPEFSAAELKPLLAEAEKWLAAVTQDGAADTPQASLKAPLAELVAGLKELASLLDRQAGASRPPEDLPAQIAAARQEIDALIQGPAPTLVEGPLDSKGVEAAVAKVTALRAEEAAAQVVLKKLEDRIAAAPDEQKKATTRVTEARAALTAMGVPPELTGVARTAAQLRLQNARLAVRVAEKHGEVLAAEVRAAQAFLSLRRAQLERARKKAEVHAAALEKLQAELKEELERRRESLDYQVQAARQGLEEAKAAGEPFGILRALQNAWLAEQRRQRHGDEEELNQARARLQKERDFLKNEQVSFDGLKRIIEQGGRRGQLVAERLRPMYQRVVKLRAERKRADPAEISRRLAELQLERAELSAVVPEDEVAREFDPAGYGLRPFRLSRLQEDIAACAGERAQSIGERLVVLNDLTQEYTELEGLWLEIDEHLTSKHDYLLERLFWIQEEAPLALDTARQASDQLAGLRVRLERDWSGGAPLGAFVSSLATGTRPWLTLAGVGLVPIAIAWLRRRVRRSMRAESGGAPEAADVARPLPASLPHGRLAALAIATGSALLWPGYFLLLSLLTGLGEARETMAAAGARALLAVAAGAALHSFGRTWFSAHGLFATRFGQPPDACAALDRMLRGTGWATVLLLAPALWLLHAGAACPAAGRVAYTGYEAAIALLLAGHLRKGGPLTSWFLAPPPGAAPGFLYRWWPLAHLAALVAAGGIVALDALGYRYGARVLSYAMLKSIVAVLVLAFLYRMLLALAQRLDTVGRLVSAAAGGAPATPELREHLAESYRKFLRLALGVLGALALGYTWGLDARVLKTLQTVVLFAIHPEANVFLTLADVGLAALAVLVTWALLTHLDGVLEVLVFPQLAWDEGLRYAVLTLMRYVIFFAGLVAAVSALHVSLGSLQWIIAAAGVGIGFGLQEVVSNFICGIILLVERPIRIGDIVTLGDASGVVKRINIRATTVENWNSESMIIPNREFIVGKVTNWTHMDTVTRLVLKIPVAYGADLEQAKTLMMRAVREHPLVPRDPAPTVWLTGFGDSGLDFVIYVYAAVPAHRLTIQEEVLARIYREFKAAGIEIPYSQHDIRLRGMPPELAALLAARGTALPSPAPTPNLPPPPARITPDRTDAESPIATP